MKVTSVLLPAVLLLGSAAALPSVEPATGKGHGGKGHGGSGPSGGGGSSGPGGGASDGGGNGGGVAAYKPCSGLYSTPQCCATDILGVADLDCANRESPVQIPAGSYGTCADSLL